MKLDEILRYYITPIRQFDNSISAEDIYQTFQKEAAVEELELFSR